MIRFILIAGITFFTIISGYAQFDRQFYMPPVWDPQSFSNGPSELILTSSNNNVNVNVRTPDGTTFNQDYIVNPGAPTVVPLTPVLGMSAEINTPELDKGLIITASRPIQAVYRIDAGNNKSIVTLKGLVGIGTEFRAGSQTHTRPEKYSSNDYHFISVMALEDNTTITINNEQNFLFEGQGSDPLALPLINMKHIWSEVMIMKQNLPPGL